MSDEFTCKQKWIALDPKPFGILSIIGSLHIIQHSQCSRQRRGSVHHRILLGLSAYDSLTSSVVFLGTWPFPKETPGVYLASGNAPTCAAQGFLMQFSVGTALYNASLVMYYFLVVFRGWKERQLRKMEPWLHVVPILFSLGTAVTAANKDLYRQSNMWCWIESSQTGFRFGFFRRPVWVLFF